MRGTIIIAALILAGCSESPAEHAARKTADQAAVTVAADACYNAAAEMLRGADDVTMATIAQGLQTTCQASQLDIVKHHGSDGCLALAIDGEELAKASLEMLDTRKPSATATALKSFGQVGAAHQACQAKRLNYD